MENKLAEILIEGEKHLMALRAESSHFLIRDAGAFLSHRKHLLASIAQRRQGRPREILIGHESHAVLSG